MKIFIVAFRRWGNRISLAYKLVPTCYIIWLFILGHRLIFYNISTGKCTAQTGTYARFDSFFEVIMSGLCPPIILLVLGTLLIRSIRRVMYRRVVPIGGVADKTIINRSVLQQIDAQLSVMVLMQTFTAIPSFVPYGTELLYSNLSQNWYKSPLRRAWEAVVIETIHLLSYFFFSTSFYISIASSRGFRHQIMSSLRMKKNPAASQQRTQDDAQIAPSHLT
ncbi:unnamed protein product [Rotaria sp. Silwood2]|nr:unnamed protein product [Rotaria sp. Silwood2]CAF3978815.1 unnamed protein product [Rotaria sp. Silwood2]